MELIRCTDCGADISSKATSCPECGYLTIVRQASEVNEVSKQEMSKSMQTIFDIAQLVSSIFIFIFGISIVVFVATNEGSNHQNGEVLMSVGGLIMFFSLLWFTVTRIRMWTKRRDSTTFWNKK